MLGWIVYEREGAKHNQKYIDWYIEEGKKLDITIQLICVEDLVFGVEDNKQYVKHKGKIAKHVNFVICRVIYPLLSFQFETLNIPVFNSSTVSSLCNDKSKTYQYVSTRNVNMVDSVFVRNKELRCYMNQITHPVIIKSVCGHGGQQVCYYDPKGQHEYKQQEILSIIQSDDVVVQPMVGTKHEDLRVYVIGNEIVAAVLRKATRGFRANYSLGGEVSLYELSAHEREIVQIILSGYQFDYVGVDFIIGDDGSLIFNEIEDVVGARMLCACSDINIVEKYLSYIKDKITGLR